MTAVHELIPGQVVRLTYRAATYITQAQHPLWPSMRLVVWHLGTDPDTGEHDWSFDALSPLQHVGDAEPDRADVLRERLRLILAPGTVPS